MKMARQLLLLLVAAECLAQQAPARRALLIGINQYRSERVPNLRGAVGDVQLMAHILKSRYGFAARRVRMLTDRQATRRGILTALKQFVASVGRDDVVYIHYSGHGSQVKDRNGDEKDGLDETIVPHDGRMKGVPDITDDELGRILNRLPTRRAVIVLDSCHSGTATRDVAVLTRAIPPDTREQLYADPGETATREIVPLRAPYVLFTGAASHQQALDGPCDNSYHGLFTYALSRSLSTARRGASTREVMRGVQTELRRLQAQLSLTQMPEPQLETERGRLDRPLFPPAGKGKPAHGSRRPWVQISRGGVPKGHALLLGAVALGARPGSLWGIYAPNETSFLPGRGRALARVVGVRGTDAVARLEPANALVLSGARAILVTPARPGRRPTLRVVGVPAGERAALARSLGDRFELVGASESARFHVEKRGDRWIVSGATGDQEIASLRDVGQISRVVARSDAASELMSLENGAAAMSVQARLVAAGPGGGLREQLGMRGIRVVAGLRAARYRIRRSGAPRSRENSLTLEIHASQDCYLTVVDVDAQGGVNLLFPNGYQSRGFYPEGRIPGGRPVRIPDSLERNNRCGFYWDLAPPAGSDNIRVFVSTDLDTANMIRQYVARATRKVESVYRGLGSMKEALAPLEELRAKLAARAVHVVPEGGETDGGGEGFPPPGGDGEYPGQQQQPRPDPAQQPYGAQQPAAPPSDWTAVTVTLEIGE